MCPEICQEERVICPTGRVSGQVCIAQNGANLPMSDRSDRFGQVFTTTSPTRTHKGYTENLSKPVQTCPAADVWFDGPITADLTNTPYAETLTQAWITTQAHHDGGPIEPVRDLWRASCGEMRKVINAMMGVG